MLTRSSSAEPPPPARSAEDALLDQALQAAERNDLEAARELTHKAAAIAPNARRVQAVAGFVAARSGDLEGAIGAYERALAADPTYDVARYHLAYTLLAAGRRRDALDALNALVRRDPTIADAQRLRIVLTAELGDVAAALAAAEQALAVLADNTEVQLAHGIALRLAGRLDEALAVQESIIAGNPENVAAWAEKGTVLHAMGELEAALDAFDEALEHNDRLVYALNGIGLVELELDMRDAALAAFEQALALEPGNLDSLTYRAMALEALGRYGEALDGYAAVLERRPDHAVVWNNIGKIRREMGLVDEATAAFRRALAIDPSHSRIHSNLLLTLLYDPAQTLDDLAREHAAWGERFGHPADQFTSWSNDRDPDRPLKIGLVAAEFGRHALSGWLLAALDAIHHAGFSVFCYSNRSIEDTLTERFKSLANGWRRIVGMSDRALAEQIRADEIDILVDISGHTAFGRLTCCALKPAPVQTSWLGYPFTTGLPAIDYCLMDAVAVRPGEERHFVEEVVRLPTGRVCYVPPEQAPDVAAPPCTRQGWITFGSFNHLAKLTPQVLETWCRLLHRLPTARLILKASAFGAPAVAERVRGAICNTGITSGRLELRGPSDQLGLLAEYGDLDIALDPFPFSGGVTSCEALWMGLPIVTLALDQPVSRQTRGLVEAIGRPEWVAADIEGYLDIAVRLASDPAALAAMRAEQRQHMRASALCDTAHFGDTLAQAFRAMWRRFVTTSPGSR
jgi:predicted O-linked N-acetylglucosamine transferase (SPINDLY family)